MGGILDKLENAFSLLSSPRTAEKININLKQGIMKGLEWDIKKTGIKKLGK
jgi:hypothetical protein